MPLPVDKGIDKIQGIKYFFQTDRLSYETAIVELKKGA